MAAPTPAPPPFAIPVQAPSTDPGGSVLEFSSTPADFDDECAMIGTLPMDVSATPLSAAGMPSMCLSRAVERDQQQRMKVAVFVAVGIVTALLAAVSWPMLR